MLSLSRQVTQTSNPVHCIACCRQLGDAVERAQQECNAEHPTKCFVEASKPSDDPIKGSWLYGVQGCFNLVALSVDVWTLHG